MKAVFEGLPRAKAPAWVLDSAEAIPVGGDLSRFHNRFALWLLRDSGLLKIVNWNRAIIADIAQLHERAALGEIIDGAALSAAWCARSAALSAARRMEGDRRFDRQTLEAVGA
jgi:hypothetical protein